MNLVHLFIQECSRTQCPHTPGRVEISAGGTGGPAGPSHRLAVPSAGEREQDGEAAPRSLAELQGGLEAPGVDRAGGMEFFWDMVKARPRPRHMSCPP